MKKFITEEQKPFFDYKSLVAGFWEKFVYILRKVYIIFLIFDSIYSRIFAIILFTIYFFFFRNRGYCSMYGSLSDIYSS